MNPWTALAIVAVAIVAAYVYSTRRVAPIATSAENREWSSEPGFLSPQPTTAFAPLLGGITPLVFADRPLVVA